MDIIGDLTSEERSDLEKIMPALDDEATAAIIKKHDQSDMLYLVETYGEPGLPRLVIHLDDLSYARLLAEAGS